MSIGARPVVTKKQMMTKKDFETSENIDHEKKDHDARKQEATGDQKEKDTAYPAKTEVKNAHASGDGSFGSNEGRLPEEEEPDRSASNNAY